MKKTLVASLAALTLAAPVALAQMGHGMDDTDMPMGGGQMGHGMDHSNMPMSTEQMDGAVHTNAVINSIGDGTANVSHDPIPEIGWPAMTMDMTMSADAQMMGAVAAGDTVTLMLIKGDDGIYQIGAIMPQ